MSLVFELRHFEAVLSLRSRPVSLSWKVSLKCLHITYMRSDWDIFRLVRGPDSEF
jgi:hypothetical protein